MKQKKEKMIYKLHKRIKDLPKCKKYIIYKNPNEVKSLYFERVNPDHVGIIWGYRKHKSKGKGFIKIAKVYFGSLLFTVQGLFDNFLFVVSSHLQFLSDRITADIGVSCAIYYILLAITFIALLYNIPIFETIIHARRC